MTTTTDWDVVIVGAGPAGLAAGLYTSRAGLRTLIVDRQGPGGQASWCDNVENYPGVPPPIVGIELIERMRGQTESFGAKIEIEDVTKIDGGKGEPFTATLAGGRALTMWTVILAMGAVPRRLGVPGEKEFTGRGVSYCATCDANFFRGKDVLVAGGGDTAAQETIFLTRHCRKVTIVHRRTRLRAGRVLQQRLEEVGERVSYLWKSAIVEIRGERTVNAAVVKNIDSGETSTVACDGVFVFVGFVPSGGFVRGLVKMDGDGYVVADDEMRTSAPGIFVCGDLRRKPLRQIVTACADGAVAAQAAFRFVEDLHGKTYP